MIESQHHQRSEEALTKSLQRYSDAGGSIIQIRTREPMRAASALRKHFTQADNPYKEWGASMGFRVFTAENFPDNTLPGGAEDFVTAFEMPMEALRDATSEVRARSDVVHYYVFHDPAPHIANNPFVQDLLQQYASILPTTNVAILFVTPDAPLEGIPQGLCLVTSLSTPTKEELEDVLTTILDQVEEQSTFPAGIDVSDEQHSQICLLGLGLTYTEFEMHIALASVEAAERAESTLTAKALLDGISRGKTEVVRQSEILELTTPEDMANVGGMRRLKDWVSQRASCYSEEAREFGVEPPKGLVLVGIPGAGKSLAAKAIASSLGVPLVRMDFARVFSKYVGDSEQRVRSALSMVEAMAPCVLFVDEIDKGLGGIGAGGDSGTSMRVLGTFLTWLQETTAPVFSMVTANRVTGLPPELLRRGRFDQIFSVTLPNPAERAEVLSIHLRKRGRDIATLGALEAFSRASEGYVPAEIESAVKDALVASFADGSDLTMDHILSALRNMIPMSVSHKESIDSIVAWAATNAIPVNYPDDGTLPSFSKAKTRRIFNGQKAKKA